MQLAAADLDLTLSGAQFGGLGAVAGLLPATRILPVLASQASGHLEKRAEHWALSRVQARIGRSDLAGAFDGIRKRAGEGRSTLRAALTSERIDVAEWRAARPPAAPAHSASAASGRDALDADVELKIGRVEGALPLVLTDLVVHAAQRAGRIDVIATQISVAGGHVSGTLGVDTAAALAGVALELRLQDLQLAQLARQTARAATAKGSGNGLDGGLNARVALRSQGDSAEALAAAAAGTVTAELVRASLPEALDAKLALDGGHWLRATLGAGRERAAVTCSALELHFVHGRGELRRLAFETPSVSVSGRGWIDLGHASVDILLTPHRKQSALLALDRSLQVSGPLRGPKVGLASLDDSRSAAPAVCRTIAMQ